MPKPLNRRRFIQSSIAAGTAASATLIPLSLPAATRSATNSVKKKMAIVT
ncbi:MAG: twin-arginine translocation signal domain-containing protein, partial [Planctomycetaceae bacterium]|nr:twin-arginine translocation signal domain-containing protein [Planctomycetaceae bacterium]